MGKYFLAKSVVLAGLLLGAVGAWAAEVKAAVAANFAPAIKRLAPLYAKKTGHKLIASYSATGRLHAQISNGASFDVFLAADMRSPQQLIESGLAVPGSNFIYAFGRLALWSSSANIIDPDGFILVKGNFNKIAVADPQQAAYGRATLETLHALGLHEKYKQRLVTGADVTQTQQFIASGQVAVGFVALAQILALPEAERGSHWVVPTHLHKPIVQEAVLLQSARDNKAAIDFLKFLQSEQAAAIIRSLGYETES